MHQPAHVSPEARDFAHQAGAQVREIDGRDQENGFVRYIDY
jgi:hypothetical protein